MWYELNPIFDQFLHRLLLLIELLRKLVENGLVYPVISEFGEGEKADYQDVDHSQGGWAERDIEYAQEDEGYGEMYEGQYVQYRPGH